MLSGRINQIALLWMIEAEKLLKEEKYVRAYGLVKIVSEFSNEGKKEIKDLNHGLSSVKENNIKSLVS